MRILCRYLFLILTVSVLSACGQGPSPTVAVSSTEPVSPLPTTTAEANLEPTAGATPGTLRPTPKPDLSLVQGTLRMDGMLAPDQTLYLVPIMVADEEMSVAGLNTATDPRAGTDETGTFTFLDVPPGSYALAIMSPVGPVVIRGADDREIVIEARAGELTELDEISMPAFP